MSSTSRDNYELIPVFGTIEGDDEPDASKYNGYIRINRSTNEMFLSDGISWNPIGSSGEGGGAPTDAQYVTLATNGTLTNERVLTAGTGISLTDEGAGSTATVAIDSAVVATLTGSQTLSNKTLTTPIITSISNSGTVTIPTGTRTLVARDTTDTLTSKTITNPVFDSYIDLNRISTPPDPGANVTRLYHKQKDSNNDGIFTKLKIGGTIGEYELGIADDVLTINELADVTNSSPAVNQTLVYQTGSSTFENKKLKTRQWMTTSYSTNSNGTRYQIWGSAFGSSTTEANVEITLNSAMTLKRVYIKIASNANDQNTTIAVRKNNANVTGAVHTVAAGVTTAFDSGELSVAYASGDKISIMVDNTTGSGSLQKVITIVTAYETEAYA